MGLHSIRSSSVVENGTELNTTEVDWNPDTVEWTQEITLGEAKLALEKVMYPFKKVSHSVEAGNGQSQGQAEFGGREVGRQSTVCGRFRIFLTVLNVA